MTDQIESDEGRSARIGVVEAFLDGETVDPSLLRLALANAAARDYFVDLLIIRGTLRRMDVAAAGATPASPRRGRAGGLAAVAAAAIVSVWVGYFAGQRLVASTPAPATVEAVVVVGDGVPAAPRPTRSIALKTGINWTDRSGGR